MSADATHKPFNGTCRHCGDTLDQLVKTAFGWDYASATGSLMNVCSANAPEKAHVPDVCVCGRYTDEHYAAWCTL